MVEGYRTFSTLGLTEAERIDQWERHNAEALVSLAARSIDGAPLEATEINLQLPSLQFARVTANAHVVERTSDHIAASETDRIALYFTLAGDAFFYHQEGVRLQRPGTLLICDVDRPFLRGFARGLQEYVLVVPRQTFEETTEGSAPTEPLVLRFADVPGGDVHAAALARLVERSLADHDEASLAATEESALDLLRTMFSPDGAHSSAAYRRTAVAWIEQHLVDPTISVSHVARAVGVSERHLARAFGETGTGVARTILELRLERARRLLAVPGSPPIGEVALRSGFVSHAHFSRVFRERYEMTPAEWRAGASTVGLPDHATA